MQQSLAIYMSYSLTHAHTHTHTHTRTHAHMHTHTHTHTYTHTRTHAHAHAHTYIHTHTCTQTHIRIHVYTLIHTQHNGWQERLKRASPNIRFAELIIQIDDMVIFNSSTISVIRDGEVISRYMYSYTWISFCVRMYFRPSTDFLISPFYVCERAQERISTKRNYGAPIIAICVALHMLCRVAHT